jgi:TorA maturation chaperone TorD
MMERERLRGIAENRSKTYWFLSSFYLIKPDRTFLEDLRHGMAVLDEQSDHDFARGLKTLGDALNGSDTEQLAGRLAVEFTRLFRGIKEGYGPPPPFESVYRESGLIGEITLAVITRYHEAGFGAIDESTGPQDHIGVELKFMSLLCYKERNAWAQEQTDEAIVSLKLQKRFLDEHLLCWVPSYCRRIQEETKESFYSGVAMLTEWASCRDSQHINMLLQEIGDVSNLVRIPKRHDSFYSN